MFDTIGSDGILNMSDSLDALGQLEQNTSDAVIRQRSSERIQIRAKVQIRPGNSSERERLTIHGLTADISRGGCCVLTGCPVMVGDIFWLSFSEEHLTIGSMFGRCLRCRMVREDTFELGFKFLESVDLATALKINHETD